MTKITRSIPILLFFCFAIIPVVPQAHHSTAVYDMKTPVTLTGIVKEFQYTNPHIWIQLLVTDENGNVQEWGIEGGSPNFLRRKGWRAKSLVANDKVTLKIFPLRDDKPGGTLISVTFEDGSVLEDVPPR